MPLFIGYDFRILQYNVEEDYNLNYFPKQLGSKIQI